MKIYNKLNFKIKTNKCVVAIGNFDGLHLGHQKVLKSAHLMAKKNNLKFGVVTFEPVPVMFFGKKKTNHRINNLSQKISGLKKLKIDFIYIIKFNKKFSNLKPISFIEKTLKNNLNAKFVFVSKNFRFGKNREGSINTLKKYEKHYSYKTIITRPLKKNNIILSSTIIRKKISLGLIKVANKNLGRNWCVEGKVIKGKKRGRKIGFPTCNIKLGEYIVPKLGVYSIIAENSNFRKKGIANIGYRPTFSGKSLLLEVNIFGIKKNLYNKNLKISFIKFIRKEKKFGNLKQLKIQIKKDIKIAKN